MKIRHALFLIASVLLLVSCGSKTYDVQVTGKIVSLPKSDWEAMENPTSFAKNFSARKKRPKEMFSQVVTVYLEAFPAKNKTETALSETEYVELFTVHPDSVTCQMYVDKGAYWLLSRQTFNDKRARSGNLTKEEISQFLGMFDEEIKETRFKLNHL